MTLGLEFFSSIHIRHPYREETLCGESFYQLAIYNMELLKTINLDEVVVPNKDLCQECTLEYSKVFM